MSELLAQPLHPYTTALLAADPHRTVAGGRLPAIPGTVPAPGHWPVGCRFAPRCAHAIAECGTTSVGLTRVDDGRLSRCLLVTAVVS